jgi:membrane-bound metal-dependent hydrolase YbcI (DUF457 family)
MAYVIKQINNLTLFYYFSGAVVSYIGSTFPDIDVSIFGEGFSPMDYIRVKGHRGVTHYYKIWLITYLLFLAFAFVFYYFFNINYIFITLFLASCFFFGIFAHILEDSVTMSGVPFYRFNKELYKSFSFKIGKYNSCRIALLSLAVFGLCIYIISLKFNFFEKAIEIRNIFVHNLAFSTKFIKEL